MDNSNDYTKSIRYSLAFQECLVRFTNAQLEPEGNPDESGATLAQEREQEETFKLLCDCIDTFSIRYADSIVQGLRFVVIDR